MTEELFQKYIDGTCGIKERLEVEEWLDISSETEKEAFFLNRWESADEKFSQSSTIKLWESLYEQIVIKQDVKIRRMRTVSVKMWSAAACILMVIASLYMLNYKGNTIDHRQVYQLVNKKPEIKGDKLFTIVNNNSEPQKISLPDGSKVILYKNSILQYSILAESSYRKLYLSGRAAFSVAKNKKKPFTVYSDEIATTAVGTKFEVNNGKNSGKILVKLLEGVVSIKSTKRELSGWINNHLLHAGEEFICESGVASSRLFDQPVNQKINIGKTEIRSIGKELIFFHTPLIKVFEQMENLYQIKIQYQIDDLKDRFLTSTINKDDEPGSLLKAIAQMNELSVVKTEDAFIIRKIVNEK